MESMCLGASATLLYRVFCSGAGGEGLNTALSEPEQSMTKEDQLQPNPSPPHGHRRDRRFLGSLIIGGGIALLSSWLDDPGASAASLDGNYNFIR